MIERIFKELNQNKLRYCHWKSNSHLDKSFNGKTDFDLLVDPNHIEKFEDLVRKNGFKKRYSSLDKVYPSVMDYVGFEENSGKLFHLHIHTKLLFGQKYFKSYRIPLEVSILNSAFVNKEYHDIQTIEPEYEYILLIMRITLKTRYDLYATVKFIRRKPIIPPNIQDEYEYLKNRINKDKLYNILDNHFPEFKNLISQVQELIKSPNFYFRIFWFKQVFRKQSHDSSLNFKHVKISKSLARLRRRNSKYSFSTTAKGGTSIALVGVDGSGKSTNTEGLAKWLSWKFSAQRVYLGINKNNNLYKLLSFLIYSSQKIHVKFLVNYFSDLRWFYIAKKRYENYVFGLQMSELGHIIIFDRFPIVKTESEDEPMDGPRILREGKLKKKELKYYNSFCKIDHIIYLKTEYEMILTRKPEDFKLDIAKVRIRKKISQIEKAIEGVVERKLFVVNTKIGKNETFLKLKSFIWNNI